VVVGSSATKSWHRPVVSTHQPERRTAIRIVLMPEMRRMYDEGKSDFEMKSGLIDKFKAF
jgi:hypothetical protein